MKFFIAVVAFCSLPISAFAGGFAAPIVTQVSNLAPIPVVSELIQTAAVARERDLERGRKQERERKRAVAPAPQL